MAWNMIVAHSVCATPEGEPIGEREQALGERAVAEIVPLTEVPVWGHEGNNLQSNPNPTSRGLAPSRRYCPCAQSGGCLPCLNSRTEALDPAACGNRIEALAPTVASAPRSAPLL